MVLVHLQSYLGLAFQTCWLVYKLEGRGIYQARWVKCVDAVSCNLGNVGCSVLDQYWRVRVIISHPLPLQF